MSAGAAREPVGSNGWNQQQRSLAPLASGLPADEPIHIYIYIYIYIRTYIHHTYIYTYIMLYY